MKPLNQSVKRPNPNDSRCAAERKRQSRLCGWQTGKLAAELREEATNPQPRIFRIRKIGRRDRRQWRRVGWWVYLRQGD